MASRELCKKRQIKNMEKTGYIDTLSYVLGIASTLASFAIFYRDNGQFWGSLAAAVMTGGLVWATYLMVRWLLLANKS